MPDSGKFKDLYLHSAHTYPCQGELTGVGMGAGSARLRVMWRRDILLLLLLSDMAVGCLLFTGILIFRSS